MNQLWTGRELGGGKEDPKDALVEKASRSCYEIIYIHECGARQEHLCACLSFWVRKRLNTPPGLLQPLCVLGFPWWLRWQRICLQCRRLRLDPWVRKIFWRREWLPTHSTPVFLLEEFWTEEPGGLQSMGLRRVGHD